MAKGKFLSYGMTIIIAAAVVFFIQFLSFLPKLSAQNSALDVVVLCSPCGDLQSEFPLEIFGVLTSALAVRFPAGS